MERKYTTISFKFNSMYLHPHSLNPRHAYSALLTPPLLGCSDLFNKLPRAYFRANYWLLYLSSFKYFATHVEKFYEQLSFFFCLECFLDRSQLIMKKYISPFHCNSHKKALSHLELIFIVDVRFEIG